MTKTIQLGEIEVIVTHKAIKNVHLSVYPPSGRVKIAAPEHMSLETIRIFAVAKLDWIKRQQAKLRAQAREQPREFLTRESHYLWGQRYLLKVIEGEQKHRVELKGKQLMLYVRSGTSSEKCQEIIQSWYRAQLRAELPDLIAKWESRLGVNVAVFHLQRMKTKWGSCNPSKSSIRLNTDLAKKPRECLEYIVLHEVAHLLERTHNVRFVALMDKHMPHWPQYRKILNTLPVAHEDWGF